MSIADTEFSAKSSHSAIRTHSAIRNPPAIRIALAALGFRLLSALLGLLANLAFPLHHPAPTAVGHSSPFFGPFIRYDSGWYFEIARNGYEFVTGGASMGVDKAGKIAFFPLYPILMRHAGRLFGRTAADFYLGGILVSWTAFVLAMVALYYLARLDLPRRRAERAVLLTAIFPFSFFSGMVYTDRCSSC